MTDALNAALAKELDRFDVPPLSAGLADRIIAAAATPTAAPFAVPRRDRRGMWRRGRQVVLGTCAVALLSAGAVASGLLGSVGIEVPVLTAMLAPKPRPVAKPVHVAPKPADVRSAIAPLPPVVPLADPTPVGLLPRPLLPGERMALREERRERREVFAAEHPVAAALIRERVRQQLQRRAAERRQALMGPGIDPSIPGTRPLDLADRAALARAARRDRLVAEKMIDRRIQAREAKLADRQAADTPAAAAPPTVSMPLPLPVAQGDAAPFGQRLQHMTPEARAARRERLQALSPEQRARLRERAQQRRAQRLGQQ
ncbi:DUF3106 domain-containing protein [Sphingomonas sp. SUN039]|uniref:DUF3106 domain-containing protein n=1 Tax=Sphingomonas sp. SUN039 TaxID=2937787 RepID=UPI00216443D8|nr:DUF3106 domain-containing protein [Sphingomonas sp. SUN039]UVO54100.1 DUF3106 domain-containing protein [Sphingomonas sp. SUN039]